MIRLLERLPEREKDLLGEGKMPVDPSPMLAVLAGHSFSDPDWIFERKFDGERALFMADNRADGHGIRLVSRNGNDLGCSYPELVDGLKAMSQKTPATGRQDPGHQQTSPLSWIADGEIVAFDDGVTSLSHLQERMRFSDPEEARRSPVPVYYYLFDLLYLGAQDLTSLPLRTRKSLLRDAFDFSDPIRFTPHRNDDGESFHREACEKGWEGIMAKRADSPYVSGRSRSWRKFKCVSRQDLVIGGFTDPGGRRTGFGALLVGYYEGDEFRYAGKVGTGFDVETLARLARILKRSERKTTPFTSRDAKDLPKDGVHWVTPKLVGEFGLSEWTNTGKLRHPRFLGLRRDKDPDDVTRERPG
jgi:bifunctional non-homologous end joining protein LigD